MRLPQRPGNLLPNPALLEIAVTMKKKTPEGQPADNILTVVNSEIKCSITRPLGKYPYFHRPVGWIANQMWKLRRATLRLLVYCDLRIPGS